MGAEGQVEGRNPDGHLWLGAAWFTLECNSGKSMGCGEWGDHGIHKSVISSWNGGSIRSPG